MIRDTSASRRLEQSLQEELTAREALEGARVKLEHALAEQQRLAAQLAESHAEKSSLASALVDRDADRQRLEADHQAQVRHLQRLVEEQQLAAAEKERTRISRTDHESQGTAGGGGEERGSDDIEASALDKEREGAGLCHGAEGEGPRHERSRRRAGAAATAEQRIAAASAERRSARSWKKPRQNTCVSRAQSPQNNSASPSRSRSETPNASSSRRTDTCARTARPFRRLSRSSGLRSSTWNAKEWSVPRRWGRSSQRLSRKNSALEAALGPRPRLLNNSAPECG